MPLAPPPRGGEPRLYSDMTIAKDDLLLDFGIALTIGALIILFLQLAPVGAF